MNINSNRKWRIVSDTIREALRLPTYPLAIRLFQKGEMLPEEVLLLAREVVICQLGLLARVNHESVGTLRENIKCGIGAACVGLIKTPDWLTGKDEVGLYTKDERAGRKLHEYVVKLGDTGNRYQTIAFAPLDTTPFEPLVIAVYATPGRIRRLIHAFVYRDGDAVELTTASEAAICTSIAKVILNGKPVVDFPCLGDQGYALAGDDEVIFSFPPDAAEQIIEGLERTSEFGIGYPSRVVTPGEEIPVTDNHRMYEEYLRNG